MAYLQEHFDNLQFFRWMRPNMIWQFVLGVWSNVWALGANQEWEKKGKMKTNYVPKHNFWKSKPGPSLSRQLNRLLFLINLGQISPLQLERIQYHETRQQSFLGSSLRTLSKKKHERTNERSVKVKCKV